MIGLIDDQDPIDDPVSNEGIVMITLDLDTTCRLEIAKF